MSDLSHLRAACLGSVLAHLIAPAVVLAHDPAGGEDILIAPLVEHVLHLVPAWVVLGAPPLLLGLGVACYLWLRGHVELVDEAE